MVRNYLRFIKRKLANYCREDIEIGKTADFHIKRSNKSIDKIKDEVLSGGSLKAVSKETVSGEERFTLYFIYSKRRGMRYTITFRKDKVRLITTIPIGRRTIRKAEKILKKRFKKSDPFEVS